jgi:hypothetical protein
LVSRVPEELIFLSVGESDIQERSKVSENKRNKTFVIMEIPSLAYSLRNMDFIYAGFH